MGEGSVEGEGVGIWIGIFLSNNKKDKKKKKKILNGNPESQKVLDTYASDTKDHRCKHRLLYPAKLSIIIDTEDIPKQNQI